MLLHPLNSMTGMSTQNTNKTTNIRRKINGKMIIRSSSNSCIDQIKIFAIYILLGVQSNKPNAKA